MCSEKRDFATEVKGNTVSSLYNWDAFVECWAIVKFGAKTFPPWMFIIQLKWYFPSFISSYVVYWLILFLLEFEMIKIFLYFL